MKKNTYLILAMLLLFSLLSSCTSLSTTRIPEEERASPSTGSGWWYVRFQISWPVNEEPQWHTDLILAHRVLSPIILQNKEKIGLWRFHRRALRDDAGHQFSFLFYASSKTAEQIFNQVRSDPLLEQMKAGGLLIKEGYDDTTVIARPHLSDTSDPRWSLPVQRTWPYYIMGVSNMWLHMISEIVEEYPSDERNPRSLHECLDFYKKVDDSITEMWKKEGCHAYFHHLSAMFEYEPLLVNGGGQMQF